VFDDTLLDDPDALLAADTELRRIAESGARVRRETDAAAEQLTMLDNTSRPRAIVAAGSGGRLLRAVLEPSCPVPFVAWSGPGLPGWAGPLDLVVIAAPGAVDRATSAAAAEAIRRGCTVVASCRPDGEVALLLAGRYSTVLPAGDDLLAGSVVVLQALHLLGLGPTVDADEVAAGLDEVATDCSPFRAVDANPAKQLAVALGDCTPLLWGGSALAARAARRIGEAVRRSAGRPTVADDADHLLPVITGAPARDVFADPFADTSEGGDARIEPALVVVDDGTDEPVSGADRRLLTAACDERDFRVEVLTGHQGSPVARYASLLAHGSYLAAYLRIGLQQPPGAPTEDV